MSSYEKINKQQTTSEKDPFTVDRYRQFLRYFPPKTGLEVLDIGCNTGVGGTVLKSNSGELCLSGLDCVKDRLDRLPADVYDKKIYGLSTDIPVEAGSFDVVVAGEFIEHLFPYDVDKTLSEIFRALKLGGRLLLTTPNPLDWKRRWRGESVLGGSHVSQHYPDALKMRLRMIGYSRVRFYGSGKMSWYLGDKVPLLSLYGSYLVVADKS